MPKFKPGDFVKYYNKNTNQIIIEQIIGITHNKYKIKFILPPDGWNINEIWNINCKFLEMENDNFTEASLLTDEDKLELL